MIISKENFIITSPTCQTCLVQYHNKYSMSQMYCKNLNKKIEANQVCNLLGIFALRINYPLVS